MSQTFTETMGTVSGTTTISTHETNNGFTNSAFIMSGTADVRTTSVSSGYTGASGGANVFFTNNGAANFLISGINTSNLNGISLSFGCLKSTTASTGNDFLVEVSADGTNFSALSFSTFPTGTGTAIWRLVNVSGNIPSVQNLTLRFRTTSTTTQYRMDDIKLSGTINAPTCSSNISTTGGLNYICQGQSIQLNASAGVSYLWSSGANTQSISINTPGTYSVQVTDAQNCVSSANFTVSQAPVIPITITSSVLDATLCASGGNAATSLTATINSTSSNLTYVWQYENSPGSYTPISGSNGTGSGIFTDTQNASPSTTKNYRIKVVDPTFPTCNYYGTQLVTVIADPVIQFTSTNPSCSNSNNGAISAIISGGTQNNNYTYNWSPTLGNNSSVSNLASGNYSLTVNGANGCNASSNITLVSPTALFASSNSGSIACNGGTTTVSVSVNGGTAPYTGTGNYTVGAGNYSYTVTDANGCTASTSITVSEPSVLTSASSSGSIACNGGTTTVSVSANGGNAPYSGTGNYTVGAGNYSYTVTDANGCTASTSITISQPTAVVVSAGNNATVYFGYAPMACTTLNASANGGTGSVSLTWSNGANGNTTTVCPNTSTTYTLTGTDANGCVATDDVTICVVNVVCFAGNSNQAKVEICHSGKTICVDASAVPAHLAHGCSLGSCSEVNACNINSQSARLLESNTDVENFNVFPNPANDILNISFTGSREDLKFSLMNGIGQILMTEKSESVNNINENTIQMNVNELSNGVYFLNVSDNNSNVKTIRVVVNK
jgi:Secretion system C-terminal sorting domain